MRKIPPPPIVDQDIATYEWQPSRFDKWSFIQGILCGMVLACVIIFAIAYTLIKLQP